MSNRQMKGEFQGNSKLKIDSLSSLLLLIIIIYQFGKILMFESNPNPNRNKQSY